MIQFIAEDIQLPDLEKNKISRWINIVASGFDKKAGNINYIFCSDKKILEVNNQFLQHDYYTDIITFDYSLGNKISGDIYIGLETVKSNSEEQKTNFKEELMRIIIHGVLHLCGLKDKNLEEKTKMTENEDKALALFHTF